jgi:hypothetical protein
MRFLDDLLEVFVILLGGYLIGISCHSEATKDVRKAAEQRCIESCECPLTKPVEHVPPTKGPSDE